MERLGAGDTVRFGGRFGTPVDEGIARDCDRVVGVATGAGLGPLLGYAEAALAGPDGPERIDLFCGFRDLVDVCGGEAVDSLRASYPTRFSFTPCISKPMACTAVGLAGLGGGGAPSTGALSGVLSGVPSLLDALQEEADGAPGGGAVADPASLAAIATPPAGFAQGRVSRVVPSLVGAVLSERTHFHLIGNGQFVTDFEAGLLAGGVAEERVTTEKYFNGKATADEAVVEFIAEALQRSRSDQAATTRG